MIQPNELRKGSIFFDAGDEQSYFAIEYFEKDFAVYRNGSFKQRMDSDCFQPVELTPDILEAAGFTNGIKTIETSFLETEFYVDLMDGDAGFNKHGLWFPCKHLHQLQNLYYCLTGDELQIDVNKLNKNIKLC